GGIRRPPHQAGGSAGAAPPAGGRPAARAPSSLVGRGRGGARGPRGLPLILSRGRLRPHASPPRVARDPHPALPRADGLLADDADDLLDVLALGHARLLARCRCKPRAGSGLPRCGLRGAAPVARPGSICEDLLTRTCGTPIGDEEPQAVRIFSGIQPTGAKHLGNFSGGFRQYAAMQELGEAFFCIVDLHSITVACDPEDLRGRTLDLAAMLFATGLDPDRSTVFAQSHVPAHAEAAWLLGAVASFGELRRMTQFKDKAERQEVVSVGLFTYPVLMAADILLYRTDRVPIGDDQRQHLELAGGVAAAFNTRFGETFVLPEGVFPDVGARIMDLQDPTRKMSTTGGAPSGTVQVLDSPETIRAKFKGAVTDSGREVRRA